MGLQCQFRTANIARLSSQYHFWPIGANWESVLIEHLTFPDVHFPLRPVAIRERPGSYKTPLITHEHRTPARPTSPQHNKQNRFLNERTTATYYITTTYYYYYYRRGISWTNDILGRCNTHTAHLLYSSVITDYSDDPQTKPVCFQEISRTCK